MKSLRNIFAACILSSLFLSYNCLFFLDHNCWLMRFSCDNFCQTSEHLESKPASFLQLLRLPSHTRVVLILFNSPKARKITQTHEAANWKARPVEYIQNSNACIQEEILNEFAVSLSLSNGRSNKIDWANQHLSHFLTTFSRLTWKDTSTYHSAPTPAFLQPLLPASAWMKQLNSCNGGMPPNLSTSFDQINILTVHSVQE